MVLFSSWLLVGTLDIGHDRELEASFSFQTSVVRVQ